MSIDLVRDSPVIGVGMFGACFLLAFLVGKTNKKIDQQLLHLTLVQVVFVPVFAWATWWCYSHPERLNIPDGWQYDMRLFWPAAAALDVALIAVCLYRRRRNPFAKATRLFEEAVRLHRQGRFREAEAAYAKGRRILDKKGR